MKAHQQASNSSNDKPQNQKNQPTSLTNTQSGDDEQPNQLQQEQESTNQSSSTIANSTAANEEQSCALECVTRDFSEDEIKNHAQKVADSQHYSEGEICDKQRRFNEEKRNQFKNNKNQDWKYKLRADQWTKINEDPLLRTYATTVQREATQLLLALMASASGLISRQPGAKEKAANFGFSLLGSLPLTGAGTAATILNKGVNAYNEWKQGEDVNRAAEKINSLDKVEEIAGGLARKLANRYSEQIQELQSKKDAKTMAGLATTIMTKHVYSNEFNSDMPLNQEFLRVIAEPNEYFEEVNDVIRSLYEQEVEGKNVGSVVVRDMYKKPGIKTISEEPAYYYREESLQNQDGNNDKLVVKYGFRTGTAEQAEALGMQLYNQKGRPDSIIEEQDILIVDEKDPTKQRSTESRLREEIHEVKAKQQKTDRQVQQMYEQIWHQRSNQQPRPTQRCQIL